MEYRRILNFRVVGSQDGIQKNTLLYSIWESGWNTEEYLLYSSWESGWNTEEYSSL